MEAIIETLFDTPWGIIILGAFLTIAIIIDFFQKPKI